MRRLKILFVPLSENAMAHVIRCASIAQEAKRRGHTVLFTSTKSKVALIESLGFKVYKSGFADFKNNHKKDLSDYYLHLRNYEIQAAKNFKPDVVVNDPVIAGNFISHALNLPLVSITNSVLLPDYSGSYGYSSIGKKLGEEYKFYGEKYPKKTMFPKIVETFKRLGISNIPSSYKELYKQQLILIPSIPILDPLVKKKDRVSQNIHYVGPLFMNNFEEIKLNDINLNRKWIFVNFGGSVLQKEIYKRTLEELVKSKFNILIATGPEFDVKDFNLNNTKFIVKKYLPGLKCSRIAQICINSGSHGTITQALHYGKPSICIPHNVDQATFSQRLVELGCGIDLINHQKPTKDFNVWSRKVSSLKENTICSALEKITEDESKYQNSCAKVQKELLGYKNSVKKTLDMIEKYVN